MSIYLKLLMKSLKMSQCFGLVKVNDLYKKDNVLLKIVLLVKLGNNKKQQP